MAEKKHKNTIRWITDTAGRETLFVILLVGLQVSYSLIGLRLALYYKNVVDQAVNKDVNSFRTTAIVMVIFVVVQVLVNAVIRYLREYTKASLENRLKRNLFSDLLSKDYSTVSATHTGEWMNRLATDTATVADGIAQIVPDVIGLLVRLVGGVYLLIQMIPDFVWAIVPAGIVIGLINYVFRKKLKELQKNIRAKDGLVRIYLQEILGSLMIIHSFNKEDNSVNTAWKKMRVHKKARMRRQIFANISQVGFAVLMNGLYVVSAIYCGFQIMQDRMTYGTLTAVLQLVSQIRAPFHNLTGYLPRYYAMSASAERLMEVEDYANDIEGERHSKEYISDFYDQHFRGFSFRDLSFTYKPPVKDAGKIVMPIVLKNINLDIHKGDYIALTGPSGCGKSTILKLLMCLYPVDSGERLILSDAEELPLTSQWRGFFAYVPQGNQLMSGTIREIVTFNDKEEMKNEEKIWEALKVSCADQFVRELKQGLDTRLGEGGAGISEGQMQRVAIARAIFSEHPILLLDESTSSLDAQTEVEVLNNIRNMTDKTMIIVTHRPAALDICDVRVNFTAEREVCISYKDEENAG
ncbi:MAG: ABC transporter ATP-binding protein [Solobacterium sp.]|nr:ABC transporter ATP-binding protein [Solobacterium sp.]